MSYLPSSLCTVIVAVAQYVNASLLNLQTKLEEDISQAMFYIYENCFESSNIVHQLVIQILHFAGE